MGRPCLPNMLEPLETQNHTGPDWVKVPIQMGKRLTQLTHQGVQSQGHGMLMAPTQRQKHGPPRKNLGLRTHPCAHRNTAERGSPRQEVLRFPHGEGTALHPMGQLLPPCPGLFEGNCGAHRPTWALGGDGGGTVNYLKALSQGPVSLSPEEAQGLPGPGLCPPSHQSP